MTDNQAKKVVRVGGLDTFHDELMGSVANLFSGEEARADGKYATKQEAGVTQATVAVCESIIGELA